MTVVVKNNLDASKNPPFVENVVKNGPEEKKETCSTNTSSVFVGEIYGKQ
jgi:hypothetical protein